MEHQVTIAEVAEKIESNGDIKLLTIRDLTKFLAIDRDASWNANDCDSQGSSSTEEQDDSTEDTSYSSDANHSNDGGQSTTEGQDDEMTTSEEETNPLLEAIMNKVSKDLSAAGITDLGF